MSLGLWEHFFVWPAASTSTSAGAGATAHRPLIQVGLHVTRLTTPKM